MRALIIDTETTGTEDTDHIVELAWWSLGFDISDDGEPSFDEPVPWSTLVKPPIPIPVTATAVHHITDEMVASSPSIEDVSADLVDLSDVTHYVAQNAPFEQVRLKWLPPKPWICTYRCAMHVWPEAPAHRNGVLRYWLKGVPHGDPRAMPGHRALPDAYITMHTFKKLLELRSVEKLVELSTAPVILRTVSFGKHAKQPWADVPVDYLQWCAKQSDMDPDVVHTVKHYLSEHYKRSGGRPK